MALTTKQKAFVEHYISCGFNATEAAKRAGYAGNRVTLASVGAENLRKPHILAEIEQRLEALKMDANEVLRRLAEQARGEHSQYFVFNDIDGEERVSVDFEAMKADGKLHLVKSIKETKYGQHIEFYDAQSALSLLGKHHQLFKEGPAGTREDPLHITMIEVVEPSPNDDPQP